MERRREGEAPAEPQTTVAHCVSEGMPGFAFWLLSRQCAIVLSTFNRTLLNGSSKHSLAHAAGYDFLLHVNVLDGLQSLAGIAERNGATADLLILTPPVAIDGHVDLRSS